MPSRTFKNLNLACLFSCMSTDEENWRSLGRMLDKKPKNQALRRGFHAASNTFESLKGDSKEDRLFMKACYPLRKQDLLQGFGILQISSPVRSWQHWTHDWALFSTCCFLVSGTQPWPLGHPVVCSSHLTLLVHLWTQSLLRKKS